MDRGVPTEEVLAEMRRSDPPVQYLCGTPKGRLNRLEQSLVTKPWHSARAGVKVKLLPEDGELYVFFCSSACTSRFPPNRRRKSAPPTPLPQPSCSADLRVCPKHINHLASAKPRIREVRLVPRGLRP